MGERGETYRKEINFALKTLIAYAPTCYALGIFGVSRPGPDPPGSFDFVY